MNLARNKRLKFHNEDTGYYSGYRNEVVDYTDAFAFSKLLAGLDDGKYGSVTKEYEALHAQRMEVVNFLSTLRQSFGSPCERPGVKSSQEGKIKAPVINLDSDEEDGDHQAGIEHSSTLPIYQRPSIQYEKVVLRNVTDKQTIQHEKVTLKSVIEKEQIVNKNNGVVREQKGSGDLHNEANGDTESAVILSPISPVGMQDYSPGVESHNKDETERLEIDGLDDLWKDMSLAMEVSKDAVLSDGSAIVERGEECDHSYVLEDDLGLVCRICGVIQKSIETIFDFQWIKATRARTYPPGSKHSKDVDEDILNFGPEFSEHSFSAADVSVHPRHMKQMRPHQIEGFSFLVRNLLADKPGGCILAHAPGSGKTFMLISFIQSFLAKVPDARPLIILPKGILATWKKEFQRWQVEDIPLYDFYSANANTRSQQLVVLKRWEEERSILFLGYKQFANIVSGGITDKIAAACQKRLLKVPSLLIMDEGHTPRNEDTDVLSSLGKVQTPCKVVLSGTLFQNHVKEVFNILNLVRPKFLKMDSSRPVVRRVLSRVNLSGRRPHKGCVESTFYDMVEETLQNDDNYKRKITVIQDLRELTQNVLHYYKGDFLEELPGFVDFTVLLNLGPKQKEIVRKLGSLYKFKRSSVGNAVYIHPYLKDIAEDSDRGSTTVLDEKIDNILDTMDARDGVKTEFFLNILSMCDAAGEKLLVFSQYLLPLKFLEKLVIRTKGWRPEKEIFMISGDTSPEQREFSVEQFNNSPDAKVFFGSIKACGEGISLVGASRVLILDVHLNPSVTRQAIGRAFRPGQKKKVYTYRLVAADSPEEEDHNTAFRKELISKLWFEWTTYCGHRDFELEKVDVADSHDNLLENTSLGEDIKALYRR